MSQDLIRQQVICEYSLEPIELSKEYIDDQLKTYTYLAMIQDFYDTNETFSNWQEVYMEGCWHKSQQSVYDDLMEFLEDDCTSRSYISTHKDGNELLLYIYKRDIDHYDLRIILAKVPIELI